jgi:hypothetical protein
MSLKFTREVQVEREVFLSQLPGAVGNREYEISGNVITVKDGNGGRVTIRLIPQGVKEQGALRLPMKAIEFDFEGFSQAQVDKFMEHYDLATRRPGGA